MVKLDILETLLAQRSSGLPPASQSLAQQMIEDSSNDAATSLWYAAGGAAGIQAYNAAAGLTGTTPSSCVQCSGFTWPGWGLSTTVPADQIALLKELIGPGTLLTSALLLITSVAECWLPGRSAEVTDAIMALALGVAFAMLPETERQSAATVPSPQETASEPARLDQGCWY